MLGFIPRLASRFTDTLGRFGPLVVLMFAACSGGGPPAGPTSVFVTIRDSSPVVPDELRLTATDEAGAPVVEGARLPESGPLVPAGGGVLGTVTVYVDASAGEVLLEVLGHRQGVISSRGTTTARVVDGHQVSAQVTLQPFVVEPDAGMNGDADVEADGGVAEDAGLETGGLVDAALDGSEDRAGPAEAGQDQVGGDRPGDAIPDMAVDVPVDAGGDGATLDGATSDAAPGPPLFLRLKFDETAGAVATDSSGNGRNGALMGGVTRVAAGKLGGAVHFDGVAGTFVALPANLLDAVRDVTVAAWVRVGMVRSNQKVFDFGDGNRTMYLATHNNAGMVRFAITTSGINGEQRLEGPTGLPVGVWTHVAVVLGPTGGTLYVDGAAVATNGSLALRPMNVAPADNVWLGRSQMTSTPILDGDIDDFRIYDRALTATEIAAVRGATQ